MRGEVGGDSPATLPVPARGWWLRAPSSLSFPFRSSCFCSGSKRGAGGGCCCPPRCAPPRPASPRLALGTCPAPTAPGAGLGSAQRARELLCKSALMRRGPGVAGGQGWSSEGPRGDSPAGSAPARGSWGRSVLGSAPPVGPSRAFVHVALVIFIFSFGKVGVGDGAAWAAPAPSLGIPAGGRLLRPGAVTRSLPAAGGSWDWGLPCPTLLPAPPQHLLDPLLPPQPLAFPSGRLCRCCAVPALPKGTGSALHQIVS